MATAEDGADALDRLQAGNAPCVVLTDLRMPRMDGWELSRAVAKDPQLASIPVVVVTGDKLLSFTSPARDKPWSRGRAGRHGPALVLPAPNGPAARR